MSEDEENFDGEPSPPSRRIRQRQKKYTQKFRKIWLQDPLYRDWLRPIKNEPFLAQCITCNNEFCARVYDIKRHSETRKHIKRTSSSCLKKNIDTSVISKLDPDESIVLKFRELSFVSTPHEHVLHNKISSDSLRQWHCFGTEIRADNLIYPVFISDDADSKQPISALPGIFRYGVNQICSHLTPFINNGLSSVLLHCAANKIVKDANASGITSSRNPVILAIKKLKEFFPALTVACDVCLCPFTSHGQCGLLSNDGTIDNEASIRRLTKLALTYAMAGANVIAPSDMMDGRVGAIKRALHQAGLANRVSVLSYAAKFSSALTGEFREINNSVVEKCEGVGMGDRRCYLIPPGSMRMALKAVERDVTEGADMLLVQPALPYIDVVQEIKEKYPGYPLFAYQVSGEYQMLLNGSSADCFDLKSTLLEVLISMRRAGMGLDYIIILGTARGGPGTQVILGGRI